MTKLGDALKRKFKTPEAAILALGLDASVLKTVMAGDKKLAVDATGTESKFQVKWSVYDKNHKEIKRGTDVISAKSHAEADEKIYAKYRNLGRVLIRVRKKLEGEDKSINGDSKQRSSTMSNKQTLTRKAAMVMGGVVGFVKPRMAKDSKINWNWGKLLGSVTNKNFASKKGAIVAGIKEQTRGKLAKDASIDGLVELLDGFEKVEGEDDLGTEPNAGLPMMKDDEEEHSELEDESMDEDPAEKLRGFLGGKGMSEDDISAACDAAGLGSKEAAEEGEDEDPDAEDESGEGGEKDAEKMASAKDKGAKDEPPPFKGKPEVGGGMSKDAVNKAIAAAVKQAKDEANAALTDLKQSAAATREAERFVRPWVGDLAMAHDSAEGVYRTALSALGMDTKGVHPSAYKVILERIPQPGKKQAQDEALAMDSAGADSFAKRFPMAMRIGQAG